MLSSKLLSGRRVLITGGSGGIGIKMIEAFAAAGANIVVCVRISHTDFQDYIVYLSEKYNVDIRILSFDLSSDREIKDAIFSLISDKLNIDILVNNAGIASGGFLNMTSMDVIKNSFQVNFFAPVQITQYLSRLMIKQKSGVIINIGSIAGLDNFQGYTAYGSSKAALMQFTKIIANELASYGIRVNAIAPALIDTNMADQMEAKSLKMMVDRSAMGRLGNPTEVANLAVFLASDQASFINGQLIRVDGGM